MARSTARAAAAKREQILKAAILRFARQSYEETSLRAIAAEVAHVHRSFGSKDLLFAEAVRATTRVERFLGGPPSLLAAKLSAELLSHQAPRNNDTVGPLDIITRSLSSGDASRVLHDSVLADFKDDLSALRAARGVDRGPSPGGPCPQGGPRDRAATRYRGWRDPAAHRPTAQGSDRRPSL